MNQAKLCIIGSEVTRGFIFDRNSHYFCNELQKLGIDVVETRVIPDEKPVILETLSNLVEDDSLVILSGGLGPTDDDLTVDCLCEYLGVEAVISEKAKRKTELVFKRRHRSREPGGAAKRTLEQALRQCRIPEGATELDNQAGLAPGIYIPEKRIFAFPGFPMEIKALWPAAAQIIADTAIVRRHLEIIPIWGVGESNLFSSISFDPEVTVGVHALPFGSRLFLSSQPEHKATLIANADAVRNQYIGQICDDPILEIKEMLQSRGETLGTAESCTGGLAASILTQVPGISQIYKGSVIAYANEVKESTLDVPNNLLAEHGAVSQQVAAAMAMNARAKLGVDYCLSFTGVAGPSGGTADKPVGTVFIGLASSKDSLVAKLSYPLDRERFQKLTVYTGFLALWQYLQQQEKKRIYPLSQFRNLKI